jgi:chromosome segregation ATPase
MKLSVRPVYALIGLTVMASAGAGVGVVYHTRRLSSNLANTESKGREMAQAALAMQSEIKTLKDQIAQLQSTNASLIVDRDNMLAQMKLGRTDHEQLAKDRDLLTQVLQRTAEESRRLRSRVLPMEEDVARMRQERDQLRAEHDDLEQRLQVALKQADQSQLKDMLTKSQQQQKRDATELKKATQELQTLKQRERTSIEQLAKARAKHDELNQRYAKIMAENTSMRHQVKRVPGNVARLAQQHQRMVKETADMHYNLGVLLTRSQQFYQAAAEFRKVLELRPDDSEAHYNLGVIYAEHLPDRTKSVSHFRRYLEINPRANDASWVKSYIASWQAWEAKERLD